MKSSVQHTSKEQVQAQRQAKRAAKHKVQDSARQIIETLPSAAATSSKPPTADAETPKLANTVIETPPAVAVLPNKSREDILAERELKKKTKLAGKQNRTASVATTLVVAGDTNCVDESKVTVATGIVPPVIVPAKVVLSKTERRAKQEAQRLAKSKTTATADSSAKEAATKSGVDAKPIVTVNLLH